MKTVVLDDDPTGTQCARDVTVLLRWTARQIAVILETENAVYLQTNSRSIDDQAAMRLASSVRAEIRAAERILDEPIAVVLRGDSTLRGHVFVESDVFAAGVAPVLFVPAYPSAGRTTTNSLHSVEVDGQKIPVGETEFAQDPVFGFSSSDLTRFVRERGSRSSIAVSLDLLRQSEGRALVDILAAAGPGVFVVPDAETNEDLQLIAQAISHAHARRIRFVVRCAAPLAAMVAACFADQPIVKVRPVPRGPLLIVCGSHTVGSTRQLGTLADDRGWATAFVETKRALIDPVEAGNAIMPTAVAQLARSGVAVVASERVRRAGDNTLDHGESVMAALVEVSSGLASQVNTVITKGGITAAEVIRRGFGARSAKVLGQLIVGVSLWQLDDRRGTLVAIVPGNIGQPDAMLRVIEKLGLDQPMPILPPLTKVV